MDMYYHRTVLKSFSQAIYPTIIIVLTAVNCSPLELALVLPLENRGEVLPRHGERRRQSTENRVSEDGYNVSASDSQVGGTSMSS